jgi:hypothetical protein
MALLVDIIGVWIACSLLTALVLSRFVRQERRLRPKRAPVASGSVRPQV